MKLCIISDTHSKHKKLNDYNLEGDVIIHCGDFTSRGYKHEIINFFKWFSNLDQFDYKIIIAGNHDLMFDENNSLAKSLVPSNVIYLEDNSVIIDDIKFYGTPYQKIFYNWAFNRDSETLKKHWEIIPDDTDVLITHAPPYKILDFVEYSYEHVGDKSLRDEIFNRIRPQINCFGHIHDQHGIVNLNNIKFINASLLNDKYHFVFEPTYFTI